MDGWIFSRLIPLHMRFLSECEDTAWCGVCDVGCPSVVCVGLRWRVYCIRWRLCSYEVQYHVKSAGVRSSPSMCCTCHPVRSWYLCSCISSFSGVLLFTDCTADTLKLAHSMRWGKLSTLLGRRLPTHMQNNITKASFSYNCLPQQEEQYLSPEAYQWEQQVRSLKH